MGGDNQDYAYYGAPYGYEQVYKSAYGEQFVNYDQAQPIIPAEAQPSLPLLERPNISNDPIPAVPVVVSGPDPIADWVPPNITYPTIQELEVSDDAKTRLGNFYNIGPNRLRHGSHNFK
jgi:hypothetical protein